MTPLEKNVYRLTRGALDGSYGADRGRKLVVGQEVGDIISLRPQGTRRTVKLSAYDAYRFAIRCQVNAVERRAKEYQKSHGGKMATARKVARKELGL